MNYCRILRMSAEIPTPPAQASNNRRLFCCSAAAASTSTAAATAATTAAATSTVTETVAAAPDCDCDYKLPADCWRRGCRILETIKCSHIVRLRSQVNFTRVPTGSIVVPLWGSKLESYKVTQKGTTMEPMGSSGRALASGSRFVL